MLGLRMSQHHIDELRAALNAHRWGIISTRTLNDHPYDFNAWTISRGSTKLEILFDRFDSLGNDTELFDSSGCCLNHGDRQTLYFGRRDRFASELSAFITTLDSIDANRYP